MWIASFCVQNERATLANATWQVTYFEEQMAEGGRARSKRRTARGRKRPAEDLVVVLPSTTDAAVGTSTALVEVEPAADRRVYHLRSHISQQHDLLTEQQDALRSERSARATMTLHVQNLCCALDELEAEMNLAEAEKDLRQRHASLIEQAFSAPASPPCSNEAALSTALPPTTTHLGRAEYAVEVEQPAVAVPRQPAVADDPPPSPALAPQRLDWHLLMDEFSHPC